MSLYRTPSQTVGPYLRIGFEWLYTSDLAERASAGERITIAGVLLDADGQPVSDGVLELWQANAHGKYAHPEDRQDKPIDPGFTGFGRIATDESGRFRFTTIKPGPLPGPGNSLQAPHILVAISTRGLLKQLYTRIYFSDEAANATDPVLALVEDPSRRNTLVAERAPGTADYRWDVILQGERETVFFDC